MPVIFLDIDGVLNAKVRQISLQAAPIGRPMGRFAQRARRTFISHVVSVPGAIERVNRLAASTGADLVVSSSWRKRGDVRPMLRKAGVTAPFCDDWATDWDGPARQDEILRWWMLHDRPPFVVLDDYPEALGQVLGRTVIVDYRIGLQDHHVVQAEAILRVPAEAGFDLSTH